jgi:hypothetical protein
MLLKLEQIFTWNFMWRVTSKLSMQTFFPLYLHFDIFCYFLNFTAFVCFSTLGKWKVICYCFEHDLTIYIYTITCTICLFFTSDNFFLCICICVTKFIPLTTFPRRLLSSTLVGIWIAFSDSSCFKCHIILVKT